MNMRINSAMAAILMTSQFTPEADIRCMNWIKLLLMSQSLTWYRSPRIATKFTRDQMFVPFHIHYNVDHTLGSWASCTLAFQNRFLCKYCFWIKSEAVLALNLLKKRLFCHHTLIFLKRIRIIIVRLPPFRWRHYSDQTRNSDGWTIIVEIVANTPKCNFIKVTENRHEIYKGPLFGPFDIDY